MLKNTKSTVALMLGMLFTLSTTPALATEAAPAKNTVPKTTTASGITSPQAVTAKKPVQSPPTKTTTAKTTASAIATGKSDAPATSGATLESPVLMGLKPSFNMNEGATVNAFMTDYDGSVKYRAVLTLTDGTTVKLADFGTLYKPDEAFQVKVPAQYVAGSYKLTIYSKAGSSKKEYDSKSEQTFKIGSSIILDKANQQLDLKAFGKTVTATIYVKAGNVWIKNVKLKGNVIVTAGRSSTFKMDNSEATTVEVGANGVKTLQLNSVKVDRVKIDKGTSATVAVNAVGTTKIKTLEAHAKVHVSMVHKGMITALDDKDFNSNLMKDSKGAIVAQEGYVVGGGLVDLGDDSKPASAVEDKEPAKTTTETTTGKKSDTGTQTQTKTDSSTKTSTTAATDKTATTSTPAVTDKNTASSAAAGSGTGSDASGQSTASNGVSSGGAAPSGGAATSGGAASSGGAATSGGGSSGGGASTGGGTSGTPGGSGASGGAATVEQPKIEAVGVITSTGKAVSVTGSGNSYYADLSNKTEYPDSLSILKISATASTNSVFVINGNVHNLTAHIPYNFDLFADYGRVDNGPPGVTLKSLRGLVHESLITTINYGSDSTHLQVLTITIKLN